LRSARRYLAETNRRPIRPTGPFGPIRFEGMWITLEGGGDTIQIFTDSNRGLADGTELNQVDLDNGYSCASGQTETIFMQPRLSAVLGTSSTGTPALVSGLLPTGLVMQR
jgi:hypothetical protein